MAKPVAIPPLGATLHQPRPRTGLRNLLDDPIYLIRSSNIVLANRIRSAEELRSIVGLAEAQEIGVLFFDDDQRLEEVWRRRSEIASELVDAGYMFVTAPSFSAYETRNRYEHLFQFRRTDVFYGLLMEAGVPAIPRIDWVIRHDIRRWVAWLNKNPCVELIALDWMTVHAERDWNLVVDGLKMLDSLLDERMHYLINGPGKKERKQELRALLGDRLTVTKTTMAAPPPAGAQPTYADPYCWVARVAADESLENAA